MFHKKFLTDISKIFDNVSYSVNDSYFDLDDFRKSCIRAIRYSDSLKEVQKILMDLKYVTYMRNAISRKLKRHFDFYSSLEHKRKELCPNENEPVVTITNDLTDDLDNAICLANFLDDEVLEIIHEDDIYRMNDHDYSYYIKHVDDEDDIRVIIYDKEENPVYTVYMDDELDIYLEDNKTNMFLLKHEDGIAIFNKDYISKTNNNPKLEEMSAYLDWNLVNHNFKGCVARLNLFKTDIKLELLLILSMSIFLLEKKDIDKGERNIKSISLFSMHN